MYRTVELFNEPEEVCAEITNGESKIYSEMNSFQHSFLCGLIKEKKPEKILEVGVSAGGTTALILTCLKMLHSKAEMYSIDLEEKWYRTEKKETGFVAKKFKNQLIDTVSHSFLFGQPIPFVIDEVGDSIDFLILDTTHALPGELLDFLICLPYLKDGCIVVLHDIIQNHLSCWDGGIVTKLLFDLVQGEKWYMREEETHMFGFSNIAAFEVNQNTRKSIYNLFSGLTFSWTYMLTDKEAEKYLNVVEKNYSTEYAKWLGKIFELQKYMKLRKLINSHYHMDHEFLKMKWSKQKNVFLYGGGYWAGIYTTYAKINGLPLRGWVISDEQDMVKASMDDLPVYRLKNVPCDPNDCAFVLALDSKHFAQVKRNLQAEGYYMIL